MDFRRVICLILAFTAYSPAGEPTEDALDRVRAAAKGDDGKLDTEKLRAFLIAEAARQSKVPLRLEFQERRTITTLKTGATQEFSIHVKLNGTLMKGATYRSVAGPHGLRVRVLIEKGDKEYSAALLPDGTWTAGSTQQRGYDPTGGLASFKQLRHPVEHRKTWSEFLKQRSILEATIENDELVVFFPHQTGVDWMRQGKLNSIGGLVGWRCMFQKSDHRLRLRRVEHIVTAYGLTSDPVSGKVKRVPHERYLKKQGLRTLIGAKEFGVSQYTEFSRYKVVEGFDLPTKLRKEGRWAASAWEIDLRSLKQNVKFKDSDFAFRPPG